MQWLAFSFPVVLVQKSTFLPCNRGLENANGIASKKAKARSEAFTLGSVATKFTFTTNAEFDNSSPRTPSDENFGVTFRSFRNGLMDFERTVKAPLSDPIIKLDEPAVFFCDTNIPVYYSDPRNNSRKEFAYVRPSIDRMLAMGHRFMLTPGAWAEFEKYEGVNIPLPDCFELFDPNPGDLDGAMDYAMELLMELLPETKDQARIKEMANDIRLMWEAGFDIPSDVDALTWTYFLTHHMALFRRFLRVKRYLDALATATERAGLQRVIDVVWLRDLQIA